MDRETRRWHNLSREVMSFLFEWEDKLIRMGVDEEDAEQFTDRCWREYAKLLPD